MLFSDDVIEREQIPAGEYYALTLFAICGMMMMAAATDLLVIFIALEILSLAVYVLTGIRREQRSRRRGRVQIFPARRVFERVLPLRDRVRLCALRLDPDRRDRHGAVARRAPAHRRSCAAGGRAARRRLCVQGLRGAVPHVDARRLRRRADDRHGVHVDGRQGGGVCRVRRACSSRRSSRSGPSGSRCCR